MQTSPPRTHAHTHALHQPVRPLSLIRGSGSIMRQPPPAAEELNLPRLLLSAPSNRAVSLREGDLRRSNRSPSAGKTTAHLARGAEKRHQDRCQAASSRVEEREKLSGIVVDFFLCVCTIWMRFVEKCFILSLRATARN